VASFLNFLESTPLPEISVTTASRFKEYLDAKGYAESTGSGIWASASTFLNRMNGFDGMVLKNPLYGNPYVSKRLIDQKYIPDYVSKQLDRVLMAEDIPLTMRCIYWLLRLIPSRISEILGMKIDCIKPFDGHFCIFIPMWKQNGGYKEPTMRTIHINDEGMGGYLLALLREQQKLAIAYQGDLQEEKQNALFSYRVQIMQKGVWYAQNRYSVATWTYISYQFKEICKKYGIRNEDGTCYIVTSHQFRHNGITDRLRAGFTLPQIAEMTAHHGTAMLYASYAHLNLFPETIVEPIQYETEEEHPYVMFGGRIFNMDVVTESRLLKNIRAHRVPGGICADVTHCQSGLWSCVDCGHFVPEVEQLSYFKDQVAAWEEKAKRFHADKQMADNFVDISRKFRKVVERLEDGCHNGK
jgi:integrase